MGKANTGAGDAAPPLRILFLTPYFRPYLGGIERAVEQLSWQLLASPAVAAVGVLTAKYAFPRSPRPEWPERERTPEGIDIFRLSGLPRRPPPIHSAPQVWFSPGQIRRCLDEFNSNIIHFVGDGWLWAHWQAWRLRRGRARFVFTPSYHTLPPAYCWLRPLNRCLCRRVDRVVALTRQEAAQLTRDYRVSPDKLAVIGWGASRLELPADAADAPVLPESGDGGAATADDAVNILCVGRLSRHKGQAWLLETYRQAQPWFHQPTRLIFAGGDEDAEADLRAAVRDAGLESSVQFTGELGDAALSHQYAQADLLALFSRYEAFGLVYFEAMLYGLPALTHRVGANGELLTAGAVVTPRYDRPAAVAALARLVNDADYRRRLGEAGRTYAEREFSWPAVADKYLSVYQGR